MSNIIVKYNNNDHTDLIYPSKSRLAVVPLEVI